MILRNFKYKVTIQPPNLYGRNYLKYEGTPILALNSFYYTNWEAGLQPYCTPFFVFRIIIF
jgi:hypothetical protein